MAREFIMTVIGNDRPGLVEALAKAVAEHGGNWLESRMCHLGGEFAGILRVQVASDDETDLATALEQLECDGLAITLRPQTGQEPSPSAPEAILEVVGHDRPGIVRQISGMLARENINVEELHTERTSAPMSGEPLFKATIHLRIPPPGTSAALRKQLEQLGADMQIDVNLKESS